jgi:hypothetical protein
MPDDFELEFEFQNQRFKDSAAGLEAFAKHYSGRMNKVPAILKKELQLYIRAVADSLSQQHGGSWPGGTTKTTMSRRSGNTMKAIKRSVKVRGGQNINSIQGQIGGPSWLGIHEYGGRIRVKRAKYLTIPLPPALDKRGVPKKKSAREWNNTFVRKSKKGNLLIFQKRGRNIVPLYVLKKEVRIPARLNMKRSLLSHKDYFIDRAMDKAVKELVGG